MYSWRHCSVRTSTSQRVSKSSQSKSSSLSLPLKLSTYPSSQGLPGVMKRVLAPTPLEPQMHRPGGELRSVVRGEVLRYTPLHHEVSRHSMTWDERNERPTRMARALPGILIHHCQETNGFAVTGTKGHKVVCPDVVPSLWPQPHAGAVSKPESTTLGLFGWYFESSPSPDLLHPLVVHSPSSHCNMAVTRRYPYRPYRLASRTTAIVRASSSSAIVAVYLCVDRGCSSARQARRSEMPYRSRANSRISAGEPGSEVSPCCLL